MTVSTSLVREQAGMPSLVPPSKPGMALPQTQLKDAVLTNNWTKRAKIALVVGAALAVIAASYCSLHSFRNVSALPFTPVDAPSNHIPSSQIPSSQATLKENVFTNSTTCLLVEMYQKSSNQSTSGFLAQVIEPPSTNSTTCLLVEMPQKTSNQSTSGFLTQEFSSQLQVRTDVNVFEDQTISHTPSITSIISNVIKEALENLQKIIFASDDVKESNKNGRLYSAMESFGESRGLRLALAGGCVFYARSHPYSLLNYRIFDVLQFINRQLR